MERIEKRLRELEVKHFSLSMYACLARALDEKEKMTARGLENMSFIRALYPDDCRAIDTDSVYFSGLHDGILATTRLLKAYTLPEDYAYEDDDDGNPMHKTKETEITDAEEAFPDSGFA